MLHKTIYLRDGRKDVTLTTYINQHSAGFLRDVRRPAVLICPGGAYLTCSEAEGEPVAMAFNAMGYHAFVLHYSTYMEGKPGIPPIGKKIEVNKNCVFPNPTQDIASAIDEICKNADEWRVDVNQLVLCGFSAGAHNCGMYSVYWKKFNGVKPTAVILGYPLTDYRLALPGPMSSMVNIATMGTAELDEEMLDTLSVIDHVSPDTPPMFLWNTSEDEQVPPQNALALACKLSEQHIPFEMHTFERGHHGLSTANECSSIAAFQINEPVAEWLRLAHRWLSLRLNINLPEKMSY